MCWVDSDSIHSFVCLGNNGHSLCVGSTVIVFIALSVWVTMVIACVLGRHCLCVDGTVFIACV